METVNRILQEKITARIAPNKAVLIFGARRVGKTVMMRKIVDNYSGRTMMLNGEDYEAAVRNFSLHHSRNGKSHRRKRHLKPARTSKRA